MNNVDESVTLFTFGQMCLMDRINAHGSALVIFPLVPRTYVTSRKNKPQVSKLR